MCLKHAGTNENYIMLLVRRGRWRSKTCTASAASDVNKGQYGVGEQAAQEGAARQGIARPGWLPRDEKRAAGGAQGDLCLEIAPMRRAQIDPASYTHLRAHETLRYLVRRLLLEKKKSTSKALLLPISYTRFRFPSPIHDLQCQFLICTSEG